MGKLWMNVCSAQASLASVSLLFGMADVKTQRKGFVQSLRKLARSCGVEAVRDDCGKEKVQELGRALAHRSHVPICLGTQPQHRTAP